MKKLLITVSTLFALTIMCALPVAAQKNEQPTGARPTTKKPVLTGKPTPAPTPAPAATAPNAKPVETPQSGVIQGRVIELGWGDALTIQDAQSKPHRVRLLGIDAPEKEQAFGPAAKQKLSLMVFSKTVVFKYQKVDRSGRPLGKVTLGALDVNLEMLKAGLAWYYPNDRDLPESDRPLYAGAEREARAAERGLWQDETPMSPWEFRQTRRQQQTNTAANAANNTEPTPEQVNTSSEAEAPNEKSPNPLGEKSIPSGKESDMGGGQSEDSTSFPKTPKVTVTGDSSTKTYYKSGCPEGDRVSPQSRVSFASIEEAEKAGYKRTPNCP
jgi:endonuclease YncB( thermonuclease family)